jgi:exopolysaccharide production protein ExoZ
MLAHASPLAAALECRRYAGRALSLGQLCWTGECSKRACLKQKINNIQALRAFAAVAVAFFHTGLLLPHLQPIGSFGVDIFFVISGYIMARICETDSRFFLRRRLIRIVPPYWLMTMLLFLFALRFPQLLEATRASGTELWKSLLFIPYHKSNGVLEPLLFVGWSLNYEMFFYLAIAAGLLLVPRRPLLFASAVVLAVTLLCHPFSGRGAVPEFYGNKVMVEFVLGIIAYEIARRTPQALARRTRGIWLGVMLVGILGIAFFQAAMPAGLPLRWQTVELLSMAVVLGASLMSQGGWDTDLAWLVLIGDASYILYLVHPYCENLLNRVVAQRMPVLTIASPLGAAIAVTVSVLVAILLHLKVERPSVAWLNQRFGGKRRSSEFRAGHARPEQVAP